MTPYVAFSMLGACGFWCCARGARGAPCPLIESVLMRLRLRWDVRILHVIHHCQYTPRLVAVRVARRTPWPAAARGSARGVAAEQLRHAEGAQQFLVPLHVLRREVGPPPRDPERRRAGRGSVRATSLSRLSTRRGAGAAGNGPHLGRPSEATSSAATSSAAPCSAAPCRPRSAALVAARTSARRLRSASRASASLTWKGRGEDRVGWGVGGG